jgi:hypothetical protein
MAVLSRADLLHLQTALETIAAELEQVEKEDLFIVFDCSDLVASATELVNSKLEGKESE